MSRGHRLISNVLWSWAGVAVMILSGVVLAPFIIRGVGHEGYGVWALAFSLVEYYWLLDLGLRRATVKYTAHYNTTGEPERINEVVNTGIVYFAVVAALVGGATLWLAPHAHRFFQVSPGFRDDFRWLVLMIGASWALGSVFNVFSACLEGFQRFDAVSRIWILVTGARSAGILALLAAGQGIVAMGVFAVASQLLGYALSYWSYRSVFPAARFSPRLANTATLKLLARYGAHAFVAVVATQLLTQSVPVLIGHFLPVAFVGYYLLPQRLLQYAAELVERIGMITNTSAAELWARGDRAGLADLGRFTNRYCFAFFLPVAIAFLIYGRELIVVWIGEDFAAQSAPLLPAFVMAAAIVSAGQYSSGSLLFGIGRHGGYARALLAEALVNIALLAWALPRYGLVGAAWTSASLTILNRGLATAWFVCRNLGYPLREYLSSIYVRPLACAVPAVLAAAWVKQQWFQAPSWGGLIAVAAVASAVHYPLAARFCLRPDDRATLRHWLWSAQGRLKPAAG